MSGKIDKIKGRVKEAVGVVTDNQRLKEEGIPEFEAIQYERKMDGGNILISVLTGDATKPIM